MIQNANDVFALIQSEGLLQKFGLRRIGIFGSLARGEKFRDIDILIEDDVQDYRKLLELKTVLEEKTGYKVDIVEKKYAEPVILHRALQDIRYAAAS